MGLADSVTSVQTIPNQQTSLLLDLNLHPLLIEKENLAIGTSKNRTTNNKTGTFFLALAFLFILSLLKHGFPSYFNNLFSIFTTIGTSKRHMKEQLENDSRASVGFYILYIISLSFVVFTALETYSDTFKAHPKYIIYLVSLVCVISLLGVKSLLIKIVAWIFQQQEAEKQYSFNSTLVNEFAGMLLFPICILMLLLTGKTKLVLLIIALIVLSILIIYKYLKNIKILNNLLRLNFIHFLLYLCAFELLPTLVLTKLILGQ
jgi:hypothetical protein